MWGADGGYFGDVNFLLCKQSFEVHTETLAEPVSPSKIKLMSFICTVNSEATSSREFVHNRCLPNGPYFTMYFLTSGPYLFI